MSLKILQQELVNAGFDVGKAGADGLWGSSTENAVRALLREYLDLKRGQPADPVAGGKVIHTLPDNWLPQVKMDRIIIHWTAGHHTPTDDDRAHYHILFDGDGKPIRGKPSIAANVSPLQANYAAHTLNCNTRSIGVSLCCMAEAVESPFDPGPSPMTKKQWDAMILGVAQLAVFYQIPITPKTVLSHAEVQGTLGIKQRGKWDITRLAFDPAMKGAHECGDRFRAEIAAVINK